MGAAGHELSSKTVDIRPVSDNAGAKCGAVGAQSGAINAIADENLAVIIACWDKLDADVQASIALKAEAMAAPLADFSRDVA